MHIIIPDEYQDAIDRLACFSLLDAHDVTRYREPAKSFEELVERLRPADVIVAVRERVTFDRALIERLPNLRLIALVGRNATTIDYAACAEHGVMVSRGESNSPTSPAELTVALILASRRNIVIEAERMRRGEWPYTLSHRLRGSTLGIFGLGHIGSLVAQAGVGLGMRVLVWGQERSAKRALELRYDVASSKNALLAIGCAFVACPAASRHQRYCRAGGFGPHEADGIDRQYVARRADPTRRSARGLAGGTSRLRRG